MKELPPQWFLRECFYYDDGRLRWKVRPLDHFKNARGEAIFNGRYSDTIAGAKSVRGLYVVTLTYEGIKSIYLLTRLVWTLVNGEIPEGMCISVIDKNLANCKINNLRLATFEQCVHNAVIPDTNTSGIKGVSWNKKEKRWRATVSSENKEVSAGRYKNIEDAEGAVKALRLKLHKEFANNG
jgi:hypothetical protein